ncbi:MAG: 2,3-epoxybenzoyl-CoA dihydrolase [Planctomycetota bacterium]
MIDFNRHPSSYRHWQLRCEGSVARLDLAVDSEYPYAEGYELKMNSYDLGVDMELADAVQRLRFEHPEIKVVVISSAAERVFCAGANIPMLAGATHAFKVNFCKFTNETRLSIEDASEHSGLRFVAAVNGACAGGGYELAIACDEIYLVNDNSSTVSLPEVPLLGVLPGTGGLTRLVDKRMIRRDRADVFSTLAEGLRGKRAKTWGLIDDTWPKSKFAEKVDARASALADELPDKSPGKGIELGPIQAREADDGFSYEFVRVRLEESKRTATLSLQAPTTAQPKTAEEFSAAGDSCWLIQCFRELDDAICQLRFGYPEIGIILLETRGEMDAILAAEEGLLASQDSWLAREIKFLLARVLRRFELTARSLFALVDQGSAFAGLFLELALACDRIYVLDDPDKPVEMAIGPLSDGQLPMSNGLTRLQSRFLSEPETAARLAGEMPRLTAVEADEQGLATFLVEDLDWEDDVRIAIEERASLSPDALTGMEASLRFGGAETCESKIFGRLSAWQNWIFIRPNATGERGALASYGKPEAAKFDWRRT